MAWGGAVEMLGRMRAAFGWTCYVQIWGERIRLTDVATGDVLNERPLVAVEDDGGGRRRIVAFGDDASAHARRGAEVINPFSHPRVLIAHFDAGERLLRHLFRRMRGGRLISPAICVVVHPMERTEGGLTGMERRAFTEMMRGAGAREVVLHEGPELRVHGFDYAALKAAQEARPATTA